MLSRFSVLRRLACRVSDGRLPLCTTSASQLPDHINREDAGFPGAKTHFTTEMGFRREMDNFPAYTVMNNLGEVLEDGHDPNVGEEIAVKMYKTMVKLNVMDTVLYDAQRQGRISFYMTSFGEEAAHVGSAAALDPEDLVFGQYRETGVILYRGFTLKQVADQCCSNMHEEGKGRQMPVHYSSRELNFNTISSPIATQLPHAAGAAYSFKTAGKPNVVICYFGDGASSQGDFHAGLNFAAVKKVPVIFFCRNNGYAISTPVTDQFAGDGIAPRGVAYGMHSIRVDGNDVWAVYNAVAKARELALEGEPCLIEAMSYRVSHHSTSDDSSRYRVSDEMDYWKEQRNPITRTRAYVESKGWWDESKEKEYRDAMRKEVLSCLIQAEKEKKASIESLFEDVYHEIPEHLAQQKKELDEHLAEFGSHYKLDGFDGGQ